jgi:predicted PurR-regulated permease PerM
MRTPARSDVEASPSRPELRTTALVVLTLATAWVVWLLARPYLGVLVWAITLAVVTQPLHRLVRRHVRREGLAAGLSVTVVALVIVLPVLFVGHHLYREASKHVDEVKGQIESGELRAKLERHPRLAPLVRYVEGQGSPAAQGTKSLGERVTRALSLTGRGLMEAGITLFALFFLFRDREAAVRLARSLLPLSGPEARRMLRRVGDTVWATIYGTVLVGLLQGVLGGLMFWWLGLPAPLVWGFVMAILAIIPVLGAFLVWGPAAIALAAGGDVGKALILAAWGLLVVGLADNLVYPVLVGKRMHLHTLPVFISLLGGLALVGACGIVVGPVVLTAALELRRIWRRRGEARLRAGTPRRRRAVPEPAPA